jgi:hypothetical protein
MTTHENGDLPEGEGVCIDVLECDLLLVLDGFLEGADRLCVDDFDFKDSASVVAVYPAHQQNVMKISNFLDFLTL